MLNTTKLAGWIVCVGLLCFAVTASAQGAGSPITPKIKTELFNGQDIKGWMAYHKTNVEPGTVWSVKNGVLNCVGKPNGYLRTEQAYANYKATVEWRFTKPGNTGVLVHMNGPEKVWPPCVECQGMHQHQGDMYFWSGSKCNEQTKGPKVPRKGDDSEKPPGEWNIYQVICADDTITILVNGKEINKATGCSPTSGYIGIQCEGAELEVRRVTVEPL